MPSSHSWQQLDPCSSPHQPHFPGADKSIQHILQSAARACYYWQCLLSCDPARRLSSVLPIESHHYHHFTAEQTHLALLHYTRTVSSLARPDTKAHDKSLATISSTHAILLFESHPLQLPPTFAIHPVAHICCCSPLQPPPPRYPPLSRALVSNGPSPTCQKSSAGQPTHASKHSPSAPTLDHTTQTLHQGRPLLRREAPLYAAAATSSACAKSVLAAVEPSLFVAEPLPIPNSNYIVRTVDPQYRQAVFPNPPSPYRLLRRQRQSSTVERQISSHG